MNRILYIILLALTSISAMGQTLTVAPVEATSGEEAELVVTAAGVGGITALQFNLSLPEGVTFSESEVTKGAAVNGHTLNVQTLANGDRLFILYNMNLNRFSDGELLRIPVNVSDDDKTGKGRIYAIRTSTIDAVSYSSIASEYTITVKEPVVSYKLTYMVDGKEYKSYDVDYGSTITPETAPTKEGYTFSGWSEIPATMPGKDVTVTGTFSVNSYKLTYMVDGKEYKSYDVEYGSAITPESEPKKEGYIFSGWSEIPKTMPADDVVVTGTFTPDTTGLDGITADVQDGVEAYFNMNGQPIPTLQKGMNIVKKANGQTIKVFVK